MQPYTWFLFLGLTLAGGAIAFMGDRLGRYMGKRRMSIFGLRPRHTALLFTVIGGMLIAVFSLVTMSLLSVSVRQALFDVENLLRERRELIADRSKLSQQNKRLVLETSLSEQRARTAANEEKRSRQQLQRTLAILEKARHDAEKRVAALRREVESRTRIAAEKSAEIERLNRQMAAIQKRIGVVTARLASAEERCEVAEYHYRQADGRFRDAAAKLDATQATLGAVQESLAAKRQELQEALAQRDASREQVRILEQSRTELAQAQRELEASRDALRAQVDGLHSEKVRLRAEADRLRAFSEETAESYRPLRFSKVVFARGQEFASAVIDGREPRARIREQVVALIAQARRVAASSGAGPTQNPEQALAVAHVVEARSGAQPPVLFDNAAIDAVTEQISRANTAMVAQIVAATNTVEGLPALGQLNLWANRVVFRDGETIARATIAPGQSTGQVTEDLVALLQGEVRAAAFSRGMIPRVSAPGASNSLSVGEASLADLVAAAEQVRKHRRGAIVEACAQGDHWTADTMRVTFRVSPAPPAAPEQRGGSILTVK